MFICTALFLYDAIGPPTGDTAYILLYVRANKWAYALAPAYLRADYAIERAAHTRL